MLSDHEQKLINGQNLLYVATLGADGAPQVSPVWAEAVDGLVVINTARGRVKERNLSRDPRVAVSAHDQANIYDHIAFRGEVVEMTEAGASDHIDHLSQKYLGKPYPWHREGEQRVIVKIRKRGQPA